MRFSTSVLPALALSGSTSAYTRCLEKPISTELLSAAKRMAQLSTFHSAAEKEFFATRVQSIDAYFHVVAVNETLEGGYIAQSQLDAQLKAMNDQYASTGIHFTLKGSDYTVNKEWSEHSALDDSTLPIEMAMKTALRKGSYNDLNVYLRPMNDGLLGICEFPDDTTAGSDVFNRDGCQVHAFSVPGGSLENYNEGKTATHEIGHWFGLFHTFQDGCDGGDQVDDTPAQATATEGCPAHADTCPGPKYPGEDPIWDFMDYSYDSCMSRFT